MKEMDTILEKNLVSEEQINEARRYAICILFDTQNFEEFAISMIGCMGEEICPLCKDLYKELYQVAFTRGFKMDGPEIVDSISEGYLLQTFRDFKEKEKQEELARAVEFKENIDELQFLVRRQRDSKEFKKMLDFVGRSRHIAPYNAMLVEMQRPGATFVFSGKGWRDYGRRVKPKAQQLITLQNFGPVQCLFDFPDTEPIPGVKAKEEAELMEMWDNGLKSIQGEIDSSSINTLIMNLPAYGVYLDESFLAANTFGGYILPYQHEISVPLNKKDSIKTYSRFLISVNRRQTRTEKFHTICHELGHLFCNHQSYNVKKKREPSLIEREFEAETVAWLVCKRCGVKNPSEGYLATYAPEGEIPICSTELIMKAVNEIEKMMKGVIFASKGMWYKEDNSFKRLVDAEIRKRKEEKQRIDCKSYR